MAALDGTAGAQNSPASIALDTSLREAVERKDVPGVVALVTDRDRVLYQSAFGVADVSTGRPLTADALFRIASMTKPITSVALMQLVEQGRIGLDDPAEKFLPELASLKVFESFDAATGAYVLRPAARPATVRHFLTHTSGLAYPFTSPIWRDFTPRAGETYPFGGPLLFDPGERWHYSTSTDVVGALVEAVSGQKLEDYFRQHIFAPLKMDDTSYNVPEAKGVAPRRATAARRRPHGRRRRTAEAAARPHHRSADRRRRPRVDRRRLRALRAHAAQRRNARRRRVLKAETVALMGQNHIGAVTVPALTSALPRSADFTFIADGRDKWGLGFLITTDQVQGKRSARQPELGRHQQHLFLDRLRPRHRRRDHDAIPAVRRRQGTGHLRHLRARRLPARDRRAVELSRLGPAMSGRPHAGRTSWTAPLSDLCGPSHTCRLVCWTFATFP